MVLCIYAKQQKQESSARFLTTLSWIPHSSLSISNQRIIRTLFNRMRRSTTSAPQRHRDRLPREDGSPTPHHLNTQAGGFHQVAHGSYALRRRHATRPSPLSLP